MVALETGRGRLVPAVPWPAPKSPGRARPRIHAFPRAAGGLSRRALPRGIVCEPAWRSQAQGAAPPEETRHASNRANSRPPLAPSQQPPPSLLLRRCPDCPAGPGTRWRLGARPLGPRGWRRGWDDVAHAWWRHQARELRRRGQPRAGPPGPRSWGWRQRGLARPRGRRPTAAGGAVRRLGGEPPRGHPRAGRAGPTERAAAWGERPTAAREPAAEAREPQSLPSGLAAPRRGWWRGVRGGGEGDPGPRRGQHEQES